MRKIALLISIAITILGYSLQGQSTIEHNWQLKTNVTGFLSDAISLELERSLSDKYAASFHVGNILNVLGPSSSGKIEGYFFRLGVKRYLSNQEGNALQSGFALQPQLIYSHWRDWYTNLRGSVGNRWEDSFGAMAVASYSLPIGNWGVVEPFFGLGYVPTWERYIVENGQPPFGSVEYRGIKVDQGARRFSYFSHFSVSGAIVFTGGLSCGVVF